MAAMRRHIVVRMQGCYDAVCMHIMYVADCACVCAVLLKLCACQCRTFVCAQVAVLLEAVRCRGRVGQRMVGFCIGSLGHAKAYLPGMPCRLLYVACALFAVNCSTFLFDCSSTTFVLAPF